MICSNELPEIRFIASREYEMFTSSAVRGSKDFLGDCLIKIARELVTTRRDMGAYQALFLEQPWHAPGRRGGDRSGPLSCG